MTTRSIAKFVARHIVWNATSAAVETTVHNNVDDADETLVSVAAIAAGWYVSAKLRPVTDSLIDRVADFRIDRKIRKIQTEEV